jgi:fructosamine-3-kinase
MTDSSDSDSGNNDFIDSDSTDSDSDGFDTSDSSSDPTNNSDSSSDPTNNSDSSSDPATQSLEVRVADALGTPVVSSVELHGGEVGRVHRLTLEDGRTVAAKTGDTPLDVEAFMLGVLDDRGLPVPERHHASADLLVLEYVAGEDASGSESENGSAILSPTAERDVARHLAALHEETPERSGDDSATDGPAFGFPRDTLSGPYRQPNPWTDSWVAFYRDHRLLFVAEAAGEEGSLSADLFDRLRALAGDLDSWLPDSPQSSLVHGDVWAENVIVREDEVRAFLDPACYFGHAEVELAYAAFSGFGDAFFETYEAERGIDAGFFEGRREVYQLYPLLEHLRYFEDEAYAAEIDARLTELGY